MFWTPPEGVEPQPLTPVLEKPEVPDSPLPYLDTTTSRRKFNGGNDHIEEEEEEEVIPPSAVPFLALFACADGLDFLLIMLGSLGAVVHGASLVVFLHLFGKIIHLLSLRNNADQLFDHFSQVLSVIFYSNSLISFRISHELFVVFQYAVCSVYRVYRLNCFYCWMDW